MENDDYFFISEIENTTDDTSDYSETCDFCSKILPQKFHTINLGDKNGESCSPICEECFKEAQFSFEVSGSAFTKPEMRRSVNYGKARHSDNALCKLCNKKCKEDEQMYIIVEHRNSVIWFTFVCKECLDITLGLFKFLNYTIVEKLENNKEQIIRYQLTSKEEAEASKKQYC